MEYIKDGFVLPVPLNLIPTPVSAYNSVKDFCKKYQETRKLRSAKSNSISGSHNTIDDQPSVYESAPHAMGGGPGVTTAKSEMNSKVYNHFYSNPYSSLLIFYFKFKKMDSERRTNATPDPYTENKKLTYSVIN